MKANELRIGNYVSAPLWRNEGMHMQKVYSLKKLWGEYYINHDFKETGCEFGAKIETEVEPIPLTEEWLFKLGFVEGSYLYKNYKVKAGDYWNSVKFYEGEWCYNNDDSDAGCYFLTTIKYVHELQNLYFAINKVELTQKTPTN